MDGAGGDVGSTEVGSRVHVIFSGIVQGVFFRANTRREALRLGLKGWVRNLPDGTVEAIVEGRRADVERLLEWCSSEIPLARVDSVDADWEPYLGEFTSFEVVR